MNHFKNFHYSYNDWKVLHKFQNTEKFNIFYKIYFDFSENQTFSKM